MNINEKKKEDEKPKISTYDMVLFSHPDIATSYLLPIDDRIKWDAIEIEVPVTLRALNPEELEAGLNNPILLQKIKDAGDFSRMMNNIQEGYKKLIEIHYKQGAEEEKQVIAGELILLLEKEFAEASARAALCFIQELEK